MKIRICISFLVLIFLCNCANQLSPGGGEVDLIPPEIVETYPDSGTVNFSDNRIELTFSEYVDKNSVR